MKSCLLADLLLAHFDRKRKIIVASDTSDYGVGAVLLHKFEDGSMKPIVHALRILLLMERSYIQIKKEFSNNLHSKKNLTGSYMEENLLFKQTTNRC